MTWSACSNKKCNVKQYVCYTLNNQGLRKTLILCCICIVFANTNLAETKYIILLREELILDMLQDMANTFSRNRIDRYIDLSLTYHLLMANIQL